MPKARRGSLFFGVIVPVGPIAPGAEARVVVPLYAGPQDQDHLQSVAQAWSSWSTTGGLR